MRFDSLEQLYSSKTDDELLALAADQESLLDEARPILGKEIRRRNLVAPLPTEVQSNAAGLGESTIGSFGRAFGAYWLNIAVAVFGTAVFESLLWSQLGHAHSLLGIEGREWLLSVTVPSTLGFVVARRWRSKTALWSWTLPVVLFAIVMLAYEFGQSKSVFADGLLQHFFAPNCLKDTHECTHFLVFTIPAVRAVTYSMAAWATLRSRPKSE